MAAKLPVPADPSARAVIDRQAWVMFELAGEVLGGLTLEECLWKPTPTSWTVHQRDGGWFGELPEETPDVATPTLGWTMWHPVWWLTTLLAHSRGEPVPAPDSVQWPGPDRALPVLRELWGEWSGFVESLDTAELESTELTRFPYTDDRPFVYVVGWASMELAKNIAEICLLRRMHRDLTSR